MRTTKLTFAIIALSVSASTAAMPPQVPDRWYTQMLARLAVMSNNPAPAKITLQPGFVHRGKRLLQTQFKPIT
jgi:hypothetical protein